MKMTEPPERVEDLALMRRLREYADGLSTWRSDGEPLGQRERRICSALHTNLARLAEDVLSALLNRVTAREMETFTAHDRHHALKVCHIMSFIICPRRSESLTPAEIALLVLAAYIHDLGMGLGPDERSARLAPSSDLWLKADLQGGYRAALERLRRMASDDTISDQERREYARQVHAAEEALLCADSRERHATRARYEELIATIEEAAARSEGTIVSPEANFQYGGDSFREDLINICISHNQSPTVLLDRNPCNADEFLFPPDAPYYGCTADTRFVAGVLRIADILDFDRERTPDILFHYLLPHNARPSENVSVREWGKHLAISSWEIGDTGDLVYRGSASDPVIHHAVVLFVADISREIQETKLALGEEFSDAIVLSGRADALIRSIGYRYLPYHFRLDEERVYSLLMGGQIYNTPLAAIRELIQNAVDACKLRDAIYKRADPSYVASHAKRISLTFDESESGVSVSVSDTGVGMDRRIVEEFFLCVGRSYYSSAEYKRLNAAFQQQGIAIAPVSDFGIGFLSCFLLGERVQVTTSRIPEGAGDTKQITLDIDGLTRLIYVKEAPANLLTSGTTVTVYLREEIAAGVGAWDSILSYIRDICRGLPYDLEITRVIGGEVADAIVHRADDPEIVPPAHLAHSAFIVDFNGEGLQGRAVIFSETEARAALEELASDTPIIEAGELVRQQVLLRGGFVVSEVPGMPRAPFTVGTALARVELKEQTSGSGLWRTNLARTGLVDGDSIAEIIQRKILLAVLERGKDAPPLGRHELMVPLDKSTWLQRFDAEHVFDVAKRVRATSQAELDAIEKWERGEAYLYEGYSKRYLSAALFRLILPRLSGWYYESSDHTFYSPPPDGWREMLRGWNTFIDEPVQVSQYATYEPRIQSLLCYEYAVPKFANLRFEPLLSRAPFSLDLAFNLFTAILRGNPDTRQIALRPDQLAALKWLVEQDNSLTIGTVANERIQLASLLRRH